MKRACLLVFALLTAVLIGVRAADIEKGSGKTVSNPPEKRTTAEYDEEAKLRIANFKMPDDITAALFADAGQTQNPSAICFDEKGRLYVAEIHRWRAGVQDIRKDQRMLFDDIAIQSSADRLAMYEKDQLNRPLSFYTDFEDRIVRVEDTDGDGRADTSSVWAEGFNDTLDGPGIGLLSTGEGELFYTNIPHLWRLRDTNGDGKADQKESIQEGFGVRMSLSGHDMHGLIQGPDGKIYWSIGDRGYSITTKEGRHYHRPYEGAVFRCDPDGSNVEEFYRGLRNPQELAFDEFGNLFTCDNDADSWDTGRLVYLLEGGDSGWNHGHQALLNFRDQLGLRTPDYDHPGKQRIPMNPWMTEGLWERDYEGRPAFALPPIDKVSWGPSGLVYNYGVTALPSRYLEHFFVCNFGGSAGDLETFAVERKGAGFETRDHHVFMVGVGNTDVEFGPDGRMYLSCFNNNGWLKQDIGNVYTICNEEMLGSSDLEKTGAFLLSDLSEMSPDELVEWLYHKDMRVRQRAQFALVERKAADPLREKALGAAQRFPKLHAIWGLGQLAREDESLYDTHIELISDDEEEARVAAVRVLSDSRLPKAGQALLAALDDESPRVRSFAAIGVGKCGNVKALDKLYEILAENDDEDPFLRHGCVQGMWYLNEREKILKKVDDDSAAVRLGVLLTLRKLEDPRVSYFFGDPDESIRFEAYRAANDLNLVTALPDLAKELDRYTSLEEGLRLPEDHRDFIIQSRLINANFRLGGLEHAERLLAYAAQTKLPLSCREQALAAVAEWSKPTEVDATVGHYRPLDPEARDDIAPVVRKELSQVIDTAEGNLLALSIQVGLQYEADIPAETLTRPLADPDADINVRIAALKSLGKRKDSALSGLWDVLLGAKHPRMRAAAVATLMKIEPERGLAAALELVNSGKLRDLQSGYRILAEAEAPEISELFVGRLGELIEGKGTPGAALDLIEAASRREEAPVKAALAKYEASLDAADPLAPYRVCLTGGTADAGETLFLTHAAGQCSKCHKIGGEGGEAGPDLSGLGKRQKPEYILESLVNPSAFVHPGYGITLMTLKNGDNIGGTLISESADSVTVRVPDPEDTSKQIEREIPLTEIATRQPPMSAMPPMSALLSKGEIRDLVAFLKGLK